MPLLYPGPTTYPGTGTFPGDTSTSTPDTSGTAWGRWVLARDGHWIRREARVLVWDGAPATAAHLLTESGNRLTTESAAPLTA